MLISAEPLVQDVVCLAVAVVPQLTARMFPVLPAVQVGQPPALGEDGAGQVWPPVIEIPGHSDVCGRLPAVVGNVVVVHQVATADRARHESRQHPSLRAGPGASSGAGARPALVISPLEVSTAVHRSGSAHHVYSLRERAAGVLRHEPAWHPQLGTHLLCKQLRLLPPRHLAAPLVFRLVLSVVHQASEHSPPRCR